MERRRFSIPSLTLYESENDHDHGLPASSHLYVIPVRNQILELPPPTSRSESRVWRSASLSVPSNAGGEADVQGLPSWAILPSLQSSLSPQHRTGNLTMICSSPYTTSLEGDVETLRCT